MILWRSSLAEAVSRARDPRPRRPAKATRTSPGGCRVLSSNHGVVSVSENCLRELWEAALADAGVEPGDAFLFALAGRTSSCGYRAKTWLRGSVIDAPDDVDAFGERLAEANSEPIRWLRRVAVWTGDRSLEGLAATLRHELEHTLQLDAFGRVLERLHERALSMLIEHAGGKPGSGVLYQAIPMEADANAAAAQFVRTRFGDARIDELVEAGDPDVAAMRRLEPPAPLEGLSERMKRFVKESGPAMAREFPAG